MEKQSQIFHLPKLTPKNSSFVHSDPKQLQSSARGSIQHYMQEVRMQAMGVRRLQQGRKE